MILEPNLSPVAEGGLFHDRYRLLGRLGAGGMGVVYQAFDERRGLKVALKTLEKISPEGLMLLKREFRIAAELRHPHLVRFYVLFATAEDYFFTMEVIEGQDLASFIRESSADTPTASDLDMPTAGPLPKSTDAPTALGVPNTGPAAPLPQGAPAAPAEAPSKGAYRPRPSPVVWVGEVGALFNGVRLLRALPQVCSALDALHQANLVHRDLKPANILVSREGVVKLLDFGIAQSVALPGEEVERPRLIEGTPYYMSPEQARGERVGPASDLYSLGVILYVLLTGRPPFQGKTTKQILLGHVRELPPPPATLAPGIPRDLERLCLALLHKNPAQRPGVREVAARLADIGSPSAYFVRERARRFVGREREKGLIEWLSLEVSSLSVRRGALIGGESGAGKSALCSEVARELSRAGWRLFTGRCYEREEIPYNAIDPLIDAIANHLASRPERAKQLPRGIGFLAKMFPALSGVPGVTAPEGGKTASEERQEAEEALRGLLGLFAQDRPVALWIDDLQWADRDSFQLLSALFSSARPALTPPLAEAAKPAESGQGAEAAGAGAGSEERRGEPALLLLGTYRSEHAERLSGLLARPEVLNLPLSPFGAEEVLALLGEGADIHMVARVTSEAHGNAFLAAEIAWALAEGEASEGDLSSLLQARQDLLDASARLVLDCLAAAGGAATFEVLRRVTRLSPPELSSALDSLLGERWIKLVDGGEGEAHDTYHDRIREIFYTSLPKERRRELHGLYAQALEERGEPEVVAGHYLRAEAPERAAPWLLRAARKAASQLAPGRAAALYLSALEAGGPGWEERAVTFEERAQVLYRMGGRHREAAEAYREAASHATGAKTVRLLLKAAESELQQGNVEAALEAGVHALAPYGRLTLPQGIVGTLAEATLKTLQVEASLSRLHQLPGRHASEADTLTHFLYHQLGGILIFFDFNRSVTCSTRSLALALSRGSDEDVVDALALYSVFVGMRRGRKNLARAGEIHAQAYRWRAVAHDSIIVGFIEMARGIAALFSGRFAEARDILVPHLEYYRRAGHTGGLYIGLTASYGAAAEGSTGALRTALARTTPLLESALADGDLLGILSLAPVITSLKLLRGDLQGAWATFSSMPPAARTASLPTSVPPKLHEAALLLANQKSLLAIALLERFLSDPMKNSLLFMVEAHHRARLLLGASYLAEARKAPSRPSRLTALRKASGAIRPLLTCDDPVLEGIAFRLAGLLEAAGGREGRALPWLERAVTSLKERGEAHELAAALLARGALSGSSSDLARGKSMLESTGSMDPALREGSGWEWA